MARLMPKLTHFYRPESLEQLQLQVAESPRCMILGGGVSLGMIARPHVTHVLVLDQLGLDSIRIEKSRLCIGATATLEDLQRILRGLSFPERDMLASAIAATATTPLRNLITVGGAVAGVGPWSDLPVALIALDGQLILNGKRMLSMEQCFMDGFSAVGAGDVITEIIIPIGTHGCGAFRKFGRNSTDLAMASAAVCRSRGGGSTIAIGGIVPRPIRIGELEEFVSRHRPVELDTEHVLKVITSGLRPRPDHRAPLEYRLHLTAQLIVDCWNDSAEGGAE